MKDTSPAVFIKSSTACNAAKLIKDTLCLYEVPTVLPYTVNGEMRGYVIHSGQVLSNDDVESIIN